MFTVQYILIPYIKQITFCLLKVNLTKPQHVVCIILCACDVGMKSCVKKKLPSVVQVIGSVCFPR
jgi:hypothetical protein